MARGFVEIIASLATEFGEKIGQARGHLARKHLLGRRPVMAKRVWAAGNTFSLADCAAAPTLFYADWVHELDPTFGHLRAYRARLLARPSVARAVDEARPFRKLFPLGAPDRD